MDGCGVSLPNKTPVCSDEYAAQSKLFHEFTNMSTIDTAWTFKPNNGSGLQAMFSLSQPDLLANRKRKLILSSHISEEVNGYLNIHWAPFPIEIKGASAIVPSPSGSKLLVVKNPEDESPIQFEIWGSSQLENVVHVPQSIHGSVYVERWFEGISWNCDETLVAYVAEEPASPKPTFTDTGYKKSSSTEKDLGSWKGQGDWEEDWGETYAGKRQPSLFVINVNSGEVRAVEGISRSLTVGQVVWAPSTEGLSQYLVFVGWPSDGRKLGMVYCTNRPCGLYAVRAPFHESKANALLLRYNETDDATVINLTMSISSSFFPRFSPDGKILVFLSAKCAVDSGAHNATNSLHSMNWPMDGNLSPSKVVDVIPVVMWAEDGCFPGLYCFNILSKPWLSDGYTMILASAWGSTQALLSVNVLSGSISRISPSTSNFSWNVLAIEGDNILAVCSSPVNMPQIKYGRLTAEAWRWLDVPTPTSKCSDKVQSLLSSLQFSIMKIPIRDLYETSTRGSKNPFEVIYISSKDKKDDEKKPLVVNLHGGPHCVSLSGFSKSLAFLCSSGYSVLTVNYRGSLGFGEEALQSLPGRIGSQDVNDVLTAIDHVINMGLADPSKIALIGGSHGGFLTTHLIGQAPNKFVAAAVRNPVCNLALMVDTSDIPDWCYVGACGSEGKSSFSHFTQATPPEILSLLHSKSPISHISQVKTPTLFTFGAKDLRVPVSNGMQYARALKEKRVPVKVVVFPEDVHGVERPQSDFEGFLNVWSWFNNYIK